MNGQANVSHLPNVRAYVAPENNVRHLRPQDGDFAPGAARAATRRPFVAKGHDAQLQDAQFSNREIRIMTISGVETVGKIIRRDKFTITMEVTMGEDTGAHEIFYKHAIESVQIKKPTAVEQGQD
jgi:sRNA-binding regulator protein Hfq